MPLGGSASPCGASEALASPSNMAGVYIAFFAHPVGIFSRVCLQRRWLVPGHLQRMLRECAARTAGTGGVPTLGGGGMGMHVVPPAFSPGRRLKKQGGMGGGTPPCTPPSGTPLIGVATATGRSSHAVDGDPWNRRLFGAHGIRARVADKRARGIPQCARIQCAARRTKRFARGRVGAVHSDGGAAGSKHGGFRCSRG